MYSVKRCRMQSTQFGTSFPKDFRESSTQTDEYSSGSFQRDKRAAKRMFTTYDYLRDHVLANRDVFIEWLCKKELIATKKSCPSCDQPMNRIECKDRSDGLKWECRRTINRKSHRTEATIRKDTWFENSNMTLEEIVKFTYWWTTGMDQYQIMQQLSLATHTGVDWDSFCREVCEITLMRDSCKIGGPGKTVQIDESKLGKRKYHRGHRVEGQWVFGGIEDSRKCFIIPVEDRSEATLLPIMKEWIAPGTLIISDCWKSYVNLEKHGYSQETVNHSKEFVNKNGKHTNKIEGQWRHLKTGLPDFGLRKYMYSGHLAEFIWRYLHKEEDMFEVFLADIKKIYNPNNTGSV